MSVFSKWPFFAHNSKTINFWAKIFCTLYHLYESYLWVKYQENSFFSGLAFPDPRGVTHCKESLNFICVCFKQSIWFPVIYINQSRTGSHIHHCKSKTRHVEFFYSFKCLVKKISNRG